MNIIAAVFFTTFGICALYMLYLFYVRWSNYSKIKDNWPPVINPCPDYWIVNSENTQCKNINNVGDLPSNYTWPQIVDPNDLSTGPIKKNTKADGLKSRCEWAIKNNIPWEGIDKFC